MRENTMLFHIGCGGAIRYSGNREEWGWEYTSYCDECGCEDIPDEDMAENQRHASDRSCWDCRGQVPMAGRFGGAVLCRYHLREAIRKSHGDRRMNLTVTVPSRQVSDLIEHAYNQLDERPTGPDNYRVSQAVELEIRWRMEEAARKAFAQLWAELSRERRELLDDWVGDTKAAVAELIEARKLRDEGLAQIRKARTEGEKSA